MASSGSTGDRFQLAAQLLTDFAARTGLVGEATPRRYLWTDAFAVCTLFGLHRKSGELRYLDLALRLVGQVHQILGRHRSDDPRDGWISGLGESEGALHPTRGGLRIGKALRERGPRETYDPRLEWDLDGQYFHYLTKWMQALQRTYEETADAAFHRWARELAATAHAAFVYRPRASGPPRMVWKMSIDLSRPLVASMGHHDPLDALITYLEIEHGAPPREGGELGPDLRREIIEADEMCAGTSWVTDDPLGIGGLLLDSARLAVVAEAEPDRLPLLRRLVADADTCLRAFASTSSLGLPASRRLAFRELGLAIGLHAVAELPPQVALRGDLAHAASALRAHLPLAETIERFWVATENRCVESWTEHTDINDVMLAAELTGVAS